MKRLLWLMAAAAPGALVLLSSPVTGQGPTPIPSVWLQTATPGIPQTGNANVSGTLRAGLVIGSGTSAGAGVVSGTNSSSAPESTGVKGVITSAAPNGTGVYGVASSPTGITFGGQFFTMSTDGVGIQGYASATSGTTYGGRFDSGSTQGYGLGAISAGVAGIYSAATGPTGQGGQFWAWGTSGTGIFAAATATSGFTTGGAFVCNSPTGYGVTVGSQGPYGVYSQSSLTSGIAYGGSFESLSTSGTGVRGNAGALNGTTFGGEFTNSSPGGYGVKATTAGPYGVMAQSSLASGTAYGGRFEASSTDGRGVHGLASATSGVTYGGVFESKSPSGLAVVGVATATTGNPIAGYFQCSGPGTGVYVTSQGPYGVNASASGSNYSIGGMFDSSGSDSGSAAVRGNQYATSGQTYGGYFQNGSPLGTGVFATSPGIGVHGRTPNAWGMGVRGEATYGAATPAYGGYFTTASGGGIGVYGYASANFGPTSGVLGEQFSPSGWAVYAAGNFGAGGTKSFRIDHPFDPENKWLLHYCSESPQPQNFYSGNITTDAKGYAWVELPNYFAEINKDFKYQLTVLDDTDTDDFVFAKVSKEIRDNRFQVRTSAPNVKVSWRIEATRNDRWVQERGAPIEPEKIGHERGKYQNPEFFGKPKELGMNYRQERF